MAPPRRPPGSARDRPNGRRRRRANRVRQRRPRTNRVRERAEAGARRQLRYFRQATLIAVAATGLLLLIVDPQGTAADAAQEAPVPDTAEVIESPLPDTVAVIQQFPLEALQPGTDSAPAAADSAAQQGTEEATATLRSLWIDFNQALPKIGIALAILVFAWGLSRLVRPVLRRLLRSWERADAVTALIGVSIWLLAIGVAFSVLTGDIRALVGSLGLVGLALSWALQTPIESFTGWLLNAFRGYYRVGDRVAVDDVYGDVYRIDILTTTVWEIGGPDRLEIHVHAEQPTGRLITFPNNRVLTSYIVNYTRDMPWVWDELELQFGTGSDAAYVVDLMQRVAQEVVGERMAEPARRYGEVLRAERLEAEVAEEPTAFASVNSDGWLVVVVRYLVGPRERRIWKSRLVTRLLQELDTPEAKQRIQGALPKRLLQFLDAEGAPLETPWPVRVRGAERSGGDDAPES